MLLSFPWPNSPPPPSGAGPHHNRDFKITLRRTTFGKTPLDEWSVKRTDLYLTTHNTQKTRTSIHRRDSKPQSPADQRLSPRGHRDLHITRYSMYFSFHIRTSFLYLHQWHRTQNLTFCVLLSNDVIKKHSPRYVQYKESWIFFSAEDHKINISSQISRTGL
jgi:hypothetical protein